MLGEILSGAIELPDDVAEAFDSMRLSVLRHRTDRWKQVSQNAVVNILYALQQMAMADQESQV